MSCWRKPLRLMFGAVLVSGALSSAPLLAQSAVWRVSYGDNHLYIAGTLNFLPATAYPLPAEFTYAYQHSDVLIQAFPLTQLDAANSQIELLQALRYPVGERLTQKLSFATQQQLADYFYAAGLDWQQFADYKPALTMLQIVALEVLAANYTAEGVALHFANLAQQDGKPQRYLGTLQQQFSQLARLGDGIEEAMLLAALQQMTKSPAFFAIEAWQKADLETFAAYNDRWLQQVSPALYQQLIVSPNQMLLARAAEFLSDSTVEMLLLDMGLLAGPDGLLQLLKQAGYQVQALNLIECKKCAPECKNTNPS